MSAKTNEIEQIKIYMIKQNRPYSVNDIFLNLHKAVGKTAVQKSLDQLVEVSFLSHSPYFI